MAILQVPKFEVPNVGQVSKGLWIREHHCNLWPHDIQLGTCVFFSGEQTVNLGVGHN